MDRLKKHKNSISMFFRSLFAMPKRLKSIHSPLTNLFNSIKPIDQSEGMHVITIDLTTWRSKLEYRFRAIYKTVDYCFYSVKNIATDRLYLKIGLLSVVSIMVIFNSFSWFYNEYVGPGALFSVGRIEHEVKQYDGIGNFVTNVDPMSTIVYESNMGLTTRNSRYIEVKNNGTLDMDYNITFQLDGTVGEAGVMYYRLYEVTSAVEGAIISIDHNTKLKAYADANPIPSNIETDTVRPISNMTTVGNFVRKNSIRITGNNPDANPRYYRLDYGMYASVNSSLYSGKTISVHLNVYSTQYGLLSDQVGTEQVWSVLNQAEFRNAASSALPGDTIKLLQDITVDGTINFSNRINLDTNSHLLKITGDLVYDFVNFGSLLINTTGLGRMEVLGNLYINTPKTEVHFLGSNSDNDVYVAGTITFGGLQDGEKDGVLLESVRIVKNLETSAPADINLLSNIRLNVGTDVILGLVKAVTGATNIEIINSGNITQVQLQTMTLLATFTKPQIYIYNLGAIYGTQAGGSSILLPSTATPYLGPNNGNTLIIKGITSSDLTVSGSANYDQGDIVYDNTDDSVAPISGESNAYIVYIKEVNRTIEDSLNSYFVSISEPDVPLKISQIKKLVIYTINAQYVINEDFNFLNSNKIPILSYLSLYNSRVKDNEILNTIKAGALSGKTSLTTVILPRTLSIIGDNAFNNAPLGTIPSNATDPFEFLTIPSSVTTIGMGAFNAAKYVEFEGITPPTITTTTFNNTTNGAKFFVLESSIGTYQTTTNINSANVHQSAHLSDSRQYFIFDYLNGAGISLLVSTANVGTTLGIPTEITANSYILPVTAIGTSAYRNAQTSVAGAAVTLPTTVERIDYAAFYNLNIISISLTNIKTIGDYAFYQTNITSVIANNVTAIGTHAFEGTEITTVSLNSINSLGAYAFASNPNLYEVKLANIKTIGAYAFYDCKYMARVYLTNVSTKTVNNAEEIDLTVGVEAMFSNWGYYISGRLRVYVPTGNSAVGNSYVQLYKNKFAANAQYIYTEGQSLSSYYHFAIPYNLTEYTVRQVTMLNAVGANITGWEIISYQGADLAATYQIPATLTVNSVTQNVISIGRDAYRNVMVTSGQQVDLASTNLLNIGERGFNGLGITSITANNVVQIGSYALEGTTIYIGSFTNLNSLGSYALANNVNLWNLNLGLVKTLATKAVYNNPNIRRLYMLNTEMNMSIAGDSLSTIGANAQEHMRIYVPVGDNYIDYYKGILGYSDYIYATGTIYGSYVNGYDIGEYAVRQVSKNNYLGTPVSGWEIIDYHGADLVNAYQIPTTMTVGATTLPVISIGRDAYRHAIVTVGQLLNLTASNLLYLGAQSFYNLSGLTSLNASGITIIGTKAFEGSTLSLGSFANLNSLGSYAFANSNVLYSLNLGKVKTMSANALYNLDFLEQVFFTATDLSLSFSSTAITDIGSSSNNRLRLYATDANASNGSPYVDVYKALFDSSYIKYFYPMGSIVGSYSQPSIPYDIGQYSVKQVTLNNAGGSATTGWEIIEYHGVDLTTSYTIPTTATVGATTYPVISIGENAYINTIAVNGTEMAITNTSLIKIGKKAFYGLTGIKSIVASGITTINDEAFRNNSLQLASFDNLTTTGIYAFGNNVQLNMINLGKISSIGEGLLHNDSNIEQIFINNTLANATNMNMTIGANAFYNVGTSIGNRLRVYVPYGIGSGTSTYVTLYKNTLPSNLTNYIYGTGSITTSYVHSILPYNIGQYMVKSVTINTVTGWEIIDYHGPDITTDYVMPTTFTIGASTLPVIAIGQSAYIYTVLGSGQTWTLNFPDTVLSIGDYSFNGRGMSSISANTLTYVGANAFEGCSNLVTVSFNGVTTIGAYAFYMNNAMTTVSVGTGVTTIGNYAFYNVSGSNHLANFYIDTVAVPAVSLNTFPAPPLNIYVPYDSWAAYRAATTWKNYNIIRTQTAYLGIYIYSMINTNEIEITKFTGNNSTLVIPNVFTLGGVDYNVTSIATGTFDIAGQLRDITLPRYLNNIPDDLLGVNTTVRNIYVAVSNLFFSSNNGILFDINGEAILEYPNDRTDTSYTLPSATRVINVNAFSNVSRLTSLTMNAELLVISYNSFVNCALLKTFVINSANPPYITGFNVFPISATLLIDVPNASLTIYRNKFSLYKYRSYIQ